nr:XRE family transcriptional regulator [Streptomyces harenosi]
MAASIRETGVSLSQSCIRQLRKGRKSHPTLRHVQAPANFFGVPSVCIFEDEVTDRITGRPKRPAAEQARMREAAQNSDVKLMALRAGQLSPNHREQVMGLLVVVYRLEQAERRAAGSD